VVRCYGGDEGRSIWNTWVILNLLLAVFGVSDEVIPAVELIDSLRQGFKICFFCCGGARSKKQILCLLQTNALRSFTRRSHPLHRPYRALQPSACDSYSRTLLQDSKWHHTHTSVLPGPLEVPHPSWERAPQQTNHTRRNPRKQETSVAKE
ncbi:unnamed protein product, partial [Pylaiella littoralis]